MAESKISPYSLNDLKNTTDDALGNYLRGLSFKQDNAKLDVRLAVGYTAVVIAAVIFAADYKLGWEATKGWTAVAVVAYTLLNGFFTYWMWGVEKGLVFEGAREGKKVCLLPLHSPFSIVVRAGSLLYFVLEISLASKTKKHDPTYYLTVTTSSSSSSPSASRQIKCPFTTWFTADGYFVAQPFQQWLASSIPAIGEADVKNASGAEQEVVDSEINGTPSASGFDKAKGSKRSKKKG
jgi:hypothetical protein